MSDKDKTRVMGRDEVLGLANTQVAIACVALERIGPWALDAFRLGLLATLGRLSTQLADAKTKLEIAVPQMREIVELLAKLPG